jgi:hypothetical protein
MTTTKLTAFAATAAVALSGLAPAIGQAKATGPGKYTVTKQAYVDLKPTQITVSDVPSLTAGQPAPFDAPGVRAIRRGKAIPRGYVLVGQQIDVRRGARGGNAKSAGAALTYRCPGARTLRTFGVVGNAGFSAPRNYVGHRQTQVFSFAPPSVDHAVGTLYAVCR